jgi:NitT/TauT family transport system permease protein
VALEEMWRSGALGANLKTSVSEFALGFGVAALVGVFFGLLSGWYRIVEYALEPFVWFLYSSPLVAFYPLFVIWVGLGPGTAAAIAFLLSLPPVLVNTATGVKNVDRDLVRAARSFGAREADVFLRVALPGSVPIVMAGLRLGIGRALTGVVVAELFGATSGLGYAISYHGMLLQTTPMMASLVVVVALGVALTEAVALLEGRFDSWRTGPGT